MVEAPEGEPANMSADVQDLATLLWQVEAFRRLAIFPFLVDSENWLPVRPAAATRELPRRLAQ